MTERIHMPERSASERKNDFLEVNKGYTKEQAISEASRCIQCKNPLCVSGCPVEINIPGFIKGIAENNPEQAIKVLRNKNNLPGVCGRVCPQEEQCELKCILGKKGKSVAIGNLERYTADWAMENSITQNDNIKHNGKKVAVIGSGPAGLTCAGDLAKEGFSVTVFESLHLAGGVLRYGIPQFRLSPKVLDTEIANLKKSGVKIDLNCLIGRTIPLMELFSTGFDAIFVGTGAGLPKFFNIQGENLNHIYSANEFLVRVNLMNAFSFPKCDTPIYCGKNVAVFGGGNTAMDSARTALRLGAKNVYLIYRRSQEEMPARVEEAKHAQEEGVIFTMLTNPVKFIGDEAGKVKAVECLKMELTEPDASGRRKPKIIENSNFQIEIDMAVIAIGLGPNPLLPAQTKNLKTDDYGHLIIDENAMTSIPGVFAGGDIVGGETVIQAMGMGKRAARSIMSYLSKSSS